MENSRWKPQERSAGPVGGAPDVSLNGPTMCKTFSLSFFQLQNNNKTLSLSLKIPSTYAWTLYQRHASYTYITMQQEPYIFNENPSFPYHRHIHRATNSEVKVELISQLGSTNGSLGARRESRRLTQWTRLKLDAKLIGVLIGTGRVALSPFWDTVSTGWHGGILDI